MRKTILVIALFALSLATAPVVFAADLFLDATGAFDMTTTSPCPLNQYTIDNPGSDDGKFWARACDQAVTEGFVVPFSWQSGMPLSGTVQVDVWILTADGSTGATTAVCTDVRLACRDIFGSFITEPTTMTTGAASRQSGIVNPGGDGGIVTSFATVAVPVGVTATERCELRIKRVNTDGACADDWPQDALYEHFTIRW